MYAILSHGGRQYRVSAGDRLLVDRLEVEVGSVIALEPVLLTGGEGTTSLGDGVEGMRVAAIVLGHRRGPKLRIFKYKAKKRYRRAAGYRDDLTEVRIDSILAKGEALPKAAAAAAAPAESRERGATVRRVARPKTSAASREAASEAPSTTTATASAPAARPATSRSAAKASPTKAAAPKPSGAAGGEAKTPAAGTAKRAPRTRRAASPVATDDSAANPGDQESGDGT